MTGNTKVWRAPLAGLASVAMIATMGVAASTANAATDYVYPGVTVTLDANGGSFTNSSYTTADGKSDVSKDQKTVTLTDYQNKNVDGYSYADGVFKNDLYGVFGLDANIQWDAQQSRAFSGWYTEKSGGQAVDPTTALADGTTLYAHWSVGATGNSDESEQVVKLDTKGEVVYASDPDGLANVVDATNFEVRLADGDTLADWELPSKDAAVNHVVPTWENASSAKAGDTLAVKQNEGATVSIKRTAVAPDAGAQYDLYKDGVAVNTTKASYDFDVLTGTALSEYQAVTSGTNKKLANAWQLTYGGKTSDYEFGTAFPSDAKDVVLEVKGGQQSTVVRVHKWAKTETEDTLLRYFVPRGQSFQSTFGKTLDEVSRPNTSFLGWYSYTDKDSNGQQTNDNYFDPNLIQKNDEVEKNGTPSVFDFTTTLNGEGIDLYAGYKNDARFTTITLDPNYSGADKISVKIYAGKKIGEQLPTVTRDGYTLTGWYTDPVTNVASQLDTDKKATTNPDYPAAGSIWYARWTADSKDNSQLNGLLNNLSRFYV
ncbi:Listeria-Bacteroides repeat domain, partial [Bifidobacterium myosotis]